MFYVFLISILTPAERILANIRDTNEDSRTN